MESLEIENDNWQKIKDILQQQSLSKDETISIDISLTIDGKEVPCKVMILQIWNNTPNKTPILSSVYGHIEVLKKKG